MRRLRFQRFSGAGNHPDAEDQRVRLGNQRVDYAARRARAVRENPP